MLSIKALCEGCVRAGATWARTKKVRSSSSYRAKLKIQNTRVSFKPFSTPSVTSSPNPMGNRAPVVGLSSWVLQAGGGRSARKTVA